MITAQQMAEDIQKQGGLVAPFILQGTDANGHAQQFIFSGITLRQHYAGLAMAALIPIEAAEPYRYSTDEIVQHALLWADALLEAQK